MGDKEYDDCQHGYDGMNDDEDVYCIGIGPLVHIIDEEIYHNHDSGHDDQHLDGRERHLAMG